MKSMISRIVEYFSAKKITEQYPKWEKSLSQFQKKIEYNFNDLTLLYAALTHKSYLHRHFEEHKTPSPFERM
ncbi:MAG TPA: ribonuclease III, partial [Candidatus Cloacimonas sp.]|nr:ribonuclease III [Candidatus Cloacimonas sp.]